MSRSVALRFLTLAAVAVSTACAGDATTAPLGPTADAASFARGGKEAKGPRDAGTPRGKKQVTYSLTQTITIDPTRGKKYSFGPHWVYIPANAMCTLDTPYGPEEWDNECDRATDPVEVTISVGQDTEGYPAASFHPDLRFAPTAKVRQWVVLGLKMQQRPDLEGYGILYQPTGSDLLIDEAESDPTLRAWRAPGNVIARRLKHFSGYNVSLGFTEQTSPLGGSLLGGGW